MSGGEASLCPPVSFTTTVSTPLWFSILSAGSIKYQIKCLNDKTDLDAELDAMG